MIKKIFKCTFALLLMFTLTLTSVNAETLENNDLKDVLIKYYSHLYDVRKTLENTENEYILPNTLLQKEEGLNSKFLSMHADKLGEQISDYNLDVDMSIISEDKDSIKVSATIKTTFRYVDSEDSSYSEQNHIVYLKNDSGKILVEKDIYDPDKDLTILDNELNSHESYVNYMNEKIKNMESKMNSKNILPQPELDSETMTPVMYKAPLMASRSAKIKRSGYNGKKGAAWAKKYANPGKDSENKYKADCTNFASWALHRGGIPYDSKWKPGTAAWIRVSGLRNWLDSKGYITQSVHYKNSKLGDIIQYKNKNGIWRHSVVVTSKTTKYPYVRVSAHSKNVCDKNVSGLYYPNGEFVSYVVLQIH